MYSKLYLFIKWTSLFLLYCKLAFVIDSVAEWPSSTYGTSRIVTLDHDQDRKTERIGISSFARPIFIDIFLTHILYSFYVVMFNSLLLYNGEKYEDRLLICYWYLSFLEIYYKKRCNLNNQSFSRLKTFGQLRNVRQFKLSQVWVTWLYCHSLFIFSQEALKYTCAYVLSNFDSGFIDLCFIVYVWKPKSYYSHE